MDKSGARDADFRLWRENAKEQNGGAAAVAAMVWGGGARMERGQRIS